MEKQTALELVEKYKKIELPEIFNLPYMTKKTAIQCAIIAVEEMIKVSSSVTDLIERVGKVTYYQSVLSELRTLA